MRGCAGVGGQRIVDLRSKTKPRTMRGFAGQRIKQRGIWGDRGLPSTRLLSVSRSAAGEGSMIDAPAPERGGVDLY